MYGGGGGGRNLGLEADTPQLPPPQLYESEPFLSEAQNGVIWTLISTVKLV